MKVCYISDDGKYFTNLEECKEYELKLNGYVVEFNNFARNYHFIQSFNNKQNCQRFVSTYIHNKLISFKTQTETDFENFFYNTEAVVYHKGNKKAYLLIDLIEEVPAHYRISPERFHDLIK